MILGVILAADLFLCDPHGLCSMQHDYVGIGDRYWPEERHDSNAHLRSRLPHSMGTHEATLTHKPCKLGEQNWKNDCN
jgi:hypothetical protein